MNHHAVPLFEALKDYHERQVIPFDVPGHKHGRGLQAFGEYFGEKVLQLDVNSMKCLDNLSHPSGVIRDAEELLADAYGVDYGFFMVNGTSSAVQAMVMSMCKPGEKFLLPRNAHKSAINAIILTGAVPAFIQPEINVELGIAMGVTLKAVQEGFERHPDAKGVFVINPTYFGAASELKAIIDYAHGLGKMVVVDEAHGAHFHFHPDLPASAASLGADLAALGQDVEAEAGAAPRIGGQQAAQHADGGGLAGAVGAEEAVDLPAHHPHGEIVHHQGGAEPLAEALHLDGDVGRRRAPLPRRRCGRRAHGFGPSVTVTGWPGRVAAGSVGRASTR